MYLEAKRERKETANEVETKERTSKRNERSKIERKRDSLLIIYVYTISLEMNERRREVE